MSYFEESDDARKEIGFVLPPAISDLKLIFPLGATYKLVDASAGGRDICGVIRAGSRAEKAGPKIHVRFVVDDSRLIEDIYPLVKNLAMSERKLIIAAYNVYGYEKEKIDTLVALGFTKGASTSDTACLNGRYHDIFYMYQDLQNGYENPPRQRYAETEDLYPLISVDKAERPLKLCFRTASAEDAGDIAESFSHQNTFRTLGEGAYQGFMNKSDAAAFLERGKQNGLVNSIICIDTKTGKAIGLSELEMFPGHVSKHVASINIHVKAQYHGLGVGTALMKETDLFAKRLHLESLVLSVFDNNDIARKLYSKMGFQYRGEVPGWLASKYVNEVFMQKKLS